MKIGLRILQRVVEDADPYKKHLNQPPRLQNEETTRAVGIGLPDDPQINAATNLHGDKPKRRYIVGTGVLDCPQTNTYNQSLSQQTEETPKPSLLQREKVANARI